MMALDYCVTFSALDAVRPGFKIAVCRDVCRGIAEDNVRNHLKAMSEARLRLGSADDLTIFARARQPSRKRPLGGYRSGSSAESLGKARARPAGTWDDETEMARLVVQRANIAQPRPTGQKACSEAG